MISKSQLLYKLELQSTLLEKSFNLPPKFGEEPLAQAIYNFTNYSDLCELLLQSSDEEIYSVILEHRNLEYLMINEIEDGFLIDAFHEEIENMATRLESMIIINMTKIQLISNLYELFGLDDESKYIINCDHLNLNWQPCFDSLQDQQAVLSSDLLINEIPFRLIATKVNYDKCSLDDLKKSLKTNLVQIEESSINIHEEKMQIDDHRNWLIDSINCLSNIESSNIEKHPCFFKIKNQNYFVYGFTLSPHLSISANDKCININIQIKDTKEKQIFIINIGYEQLVIECIFLDKAEGDECSYSSGNQWVQDSILSRGDACKFPTVFNKSYYLMTMHRRQRL